ncbi:MAG: penicillin acylase family protein [bacterium]|nr:penicillin acylase family protein [bacterium]
MRRSTGRHLVRAAGLLFAGGSLAACALLAPLPEPRGLADRLAVFPDHGVDLDGRVTIRWNDHQVPFIEALSDDDAAFALGMVHAHLRLAQMSLVRMAARGRLAEVAGPLASDIDHGLRILSFGHAARDIEAAMESGARRWTQRFVDGINHYQATLDDLPQEFGVLGMEREPWTVTDVLTIGRLVGTDVNWLIWSGLLPLRKRPDWPQLWARLVESGSASLPSFADADVNAILAGVGRTGSNSMAIGPERTTTGGAIIANDPHLGILVPNVWLIAGLKSPSYHVVGLMGPGLPVFAIGRNPSIAWGGTNMRAASSDLVDVSDLDPDAIETRDETISVRWWFDSTVTIRQTPLGPVISDAPFLSDNGLPDLALRWTGHDASDEIGAMLAVSRARDFTGFRTAFDTFAVPGQNMIFADHDGNIGQVMAVTLPQRTGSPGDIVADAGEVTRTWATMQSSGDFPWSYNPRQGYLVSANNRPTRTATPVGFFFSSDDRVSRLASLTGGGGRLDVAAVKAIQRDVYMPSSARLRDDFIEGLEAAGLVSSAGREAAEAITRMRNWDGHYRAGSVGAVSFEQFRAGFVHSFYSRLLGEEHGAIMARRGGVLVRDMEQASREVLDAALTAGLEAAEKGLDVFTDWSDMHRLSLAHPLSMLPVIGERYRFGDHGVGGSSETIMKTAHDASATRHTVRYGANARHVSDMTDMDENYFVLLGGQDGWLNSSTMLDQWPLWQSGGYVRMPLTPEGVRASFPHVTVIDN